VELIWICFFVKQGIMISFYNI